MEYLRRDRLRRSAAIERVLADKMKRSAIGSLADLRAAYQDELIEHAAEIEAQVENVIALNRKMGARNRAAHLAELRCAVCDSPIAGAKRFSRRFCSDRCRQRAHRQQD